MRALQTVELAFQVGGQIDTLPVVEGDILEEGDVVASLERTGFERTLRQAEITLSQDQQDLDRFEQLSGTGVPRSEVSAATTRVDLSRVAVEEAEAALQDATLHAPFDALVARRMVANYTTVSAGQPVVRLHDMSQVLIDINIPEVLVGATQDGSTTFTATFPGRNRTYPLSIQEFEAESADVGQTFRLSLRIDSDNASGILPGASAMVLIEHQADSRQMVILPPEALVYAPDGSAQVFVFEPDAETEGAGRVTLTPVEIRLRDDAHVELIDGPAPGTEIVAAGATMIEDGQTVRRFTGLGE
ncbi:efflux RND transporter periplasmic adaptor subunit [Salipiger sp. IMCC34102]|nr:efflux RND transporter periplasmic adaptor subunit [Salipiger sp. IMCC34102]